jgi:hypothetical protein
MLTPIKIVEKKIDKLYYVHIMEYDIHFIFLFNDIDINWSIFNICLTLAKN